MGHSAVLCSWPPFHWPARDRPLRLINFLLYIVGDPRGHRREVTKSGSEAEPQWECRPLASDPTAPELARQSPRDVPWAKCWRLTPPVWPTASLEQESRRERWQQRQQWRQQRLRRLHQRSVSKEKWVETLVVADAKMVEYHGQPHVESYVLTIMNMVGQCWEDRWVAWEAGAR